MRAGGAGSSNISDGIFEVYPDWAQQTAVPATMKAGDCSFHSGLLAHAAGANMTPGRRRAMTCAYMPDGKCPKTLPTSSLLLSSEMIPPHTNTALYALLHSPL